MLAVPDEITRLDVAFGNISHMPKYETIPDEFKTFGGSLFCDAVSYWFFKGAKRAKNGIQIKDMIFTAKSGADAEKALGAIKAILCSFEPKHEHKEAACAFLLAEWFDLKK